jgi:Lrp/AsnC family leucine-responsive transcriptional regulator
MPLDEFDHRILTALQQDARQTNQALAERVGLSPTPCLRRVKRLERDGIIDSYRAVINRKVLGFGLTIFVTVKVARHQDRDAEQFVRTVTGWPEVLACHLVSGDMDFLMEVVARDMEAYERFILKRLLKIPGVKDLRSNFAMRSYKTGGVLPASR